MKDKQNLLQAPACSTREYTRGRYVSNNKNVSLELHLRGQADVNKSKKAKSEKKKQRNDSALLASTTKTKSMCQQCEKRTKISTQSTYTHSWKTMRVPTHLVRPCAACFELSHFFFPLSAILIFCLFLWAMQPRSIFRLRGSEMAECAIATAAKETNLKKPNS